MGRKLFDVALQQGYRQVPAHVRRSRLVHGASLKGSAKRAMMEQMRLCRQDAERIEMAFISTANTIRESVSPRGRRTADGQQVHPPIEHEGAPLLLVEAVQTTSERKAEDVLAHTLSQLRATLASTGNGILMIDWRGKIDSMKRIGISNRMRPSMACAGPLKTFPFPAVGAVAALKWRNRWSPIGAWPGANAAAPRSASNPPYYVLTN